MPDDLLIDDAEAHLRHYGRWLEERSNVVLSPDGEPGRDTGQMNEPTRGSAARRAMMVSAVAAALVVMVVTGLAVAGNHARTHVSNFDLAFYTFDQQGGWERKLRSSVAPDNDELDGAIVGARRVRGRWQNKASLEFKRPGDRVRPPDENRGVADRPARRAATAPGFAPQRQALPGSRL